MEKEISSGAMLGVVLIALAAIIGLGFGIFSLAKSTANNGVTDLQENLQSVSQSAYTDYDQKIITGTQVISACQTFEGKNVSILISTQATKNKTGDSGSLADTNDEDAGGAGVYKAYGDADKDLPYVVAIQYAAEGEDEAEYTTTTSDGEEVQLSFINYNALLAGCQFGKTTSTLDQSGVEGGHGTVAFDSNCWRTTNGYATNNGKVLFNNNTGNLSKSGMMEYVPSGARFQAYLIKDLSGTTMGVAFEQINSGV